MKKLDILIKFKDFIEAVMALDKTPEYEPEYGIKNKKAANRLGEFPEVGQSWKTPRELAGGIRNLLNKLLIEAMREEDPKLICQSCDQKLNEQGGSI